MRTEEDVILGRIVTAVVAFLLLCGVALLVGLGWGAWKAIERFV